MVEYSFPTSTGNEVFYGMQFLAAPYSVLAVERTRA